MKRKRFSLRRLFHQGGTGSGNFGHEGRPGLVGGSSDEGSSHSKSSKERRELRSILSDAEKFEKGLPKKLGEFKTPDTERKTSNAIGKITGIKPSKSYGQKDVYNIRGVKESKLSTVQSSLENMGFEKYKDPWSRESTLSYRSKNNLIVHIYPQEDKTYDMSFTRIEHVPVPID